MKKEHYLHIPKPCQENWDTMATVEKGKFCASCSKEVIDFSLLTDAEILNSLKKSTGNTCGRFNTDQLQRPMQEIKIEKRKGWKWLLATITSLIMLSRSQAQKKENCGVLLGKIAVAEQSKNKPVIKRGTGIKVAAYPVINLPPPKITKPASDIVGDVMIIATGRKVKIEGYILDDKNNAIPGVLIYTGKDIRGYTDFNGHFEITTVPSAEKISMTYRVFGFEDGNAVIELQEYQAPLRIFMKPKVTVLPDITVVSYPPIKCKVMMGELVSYQKVSKKDTVVALISKILDTPFHITGNILKIFPNPAVKNSTIHLSIKEPGNYQVLLFDNASRLLQSEEKNCTVKQQSMDLQLSANMASGFYYIRLINMQTKKSYTDKVIIQ